MLARVSRGRMTNLVEEPIYAILERAPGDAGRDDWDGLWRRSPAWRRGLLRRLLRRHPWHQRHARTCTRHAWGCSRWCSRRHGAHAHAHTRCGGTRRAAKMRHLPLLWMLLRGVRTLSRRWWCTSTRWTATTAATAVRHGWWCTVARRSRGSTSSAWRSHRTWSCPTWRRCRRTRECQGARRSPTWHAWRWWPTGRTSTRRHATRRAWRWWNTGGAGSPWRSPARRCGAGGPAWRQRAAPIVACRCRWVTRRTRLCKGRRAVAESGGWRPRW
mmetsp:Transcript_11828/g.26073  ORF Transcript_11828/g.26073 Transcript_11828/m.26073 type:complete len:272 (-) Transcript_11828:295-1110(-)